MVFLPKPLSIVLSGFILLALAVAASQSALAAGVSPTFFAKWMQQKNDKTRADKKEKKRARRADENGKPKEPGEVDDTAAESSSPAEEVTLLSDSQSVVGDLVVCEGYVNATLGNIRLQADKVTFNETTGDMVAEGNVIFDEGSDQRVTAKRAEINWNSGRGVFWETTGFTNRTQLGDYVFYTAERVEKTGPETYELTGASVTACEDVVPKWVFTTKRAELKMNDRLKLHNAVFRVKGIPAFVLPYAWIPATRTERKSGFLIPTSGTSNAKGRTFKTAYYQTLGESADITFRNDIYTSRGIGVGAEFRAQTSDESYMRLGVFTVKDRLFGPPGDDQGGTAFVAEGVQYLPHGWLAVGNVSLVSSLDFRQVFSDDISQVVDPRRESNFYANNNAGNFSFSLLASNETTTLFRPSETSRPETGTDFDILIRKAPQVDIVVYPRRILSSLPVYFSFETSLGALKREERVADTAVLATPAAVQRFDIQPKITVPLATFAGIAITPSLTLRETFYTSSIDPRVPAFNPEAFSLTPGDPRLDPTNSVFDPGLMLFDRTLLDPIVPQNLSRHYAEFAIDVRPPTLEKVILNKDGSRRFKHVIEPYFTYRTIRGIGDEFDNIIRFDERDAVANTNEFEYSIVNRFFTNRRTSEFRRKRSRSQEGQPSEMDPVSPDGKKRGRRSRDGQAESGTKEPATPRSSDAPPLKDKSETSADTPVKKLKLESGRQADLGREGVSEQRREPRKAGDTTGAGEDPADLQEDDADEATNEDSPVQPYELLSIKVSQKYFLDRDFGGALIEGRRNQFYPINTLSGFSYGGRARSFSPANIQVRYRPLSSVFGDVRMDVGGDEEAVRNITVSAGFDTDEISVRSRWYLSRRIDLDPNRFEAGTFPGNQLVTTIQFGDESKGLYWGTRINYDFTDRLVENNEVSIGRLRHSRSFVGYGWDCCGVQFNYNTFKAGLRNESAFSFSFTLAGIGSFGSDQFSQLGGGRGGRKRGKKLKRIMDDDF